MSVDHAVPPSALKVSLFIVLVLLFGAQLLIDHFAPGES
jgi:hypothetical protein